jgi:hypothetical protein
MRRYCGRRVQFLTPETWIAAVTGGFAFIGLISGFIAWAIKTTKASTEAMVALRVSLDNNSKVIERITEKLDKHDDTLDDHGNRLVAIETEHRVRHGERRAYELSESD